MIILHKTISGRCGFFGTVCSLMPRPLCFLKGRKNIYNNYM